MTNQPSIREEVYGANLSDEFRRLIQERRWRPLIRMSGIAAWTGGMLVVLLLGMWTATPWAQARLWWRNRVVRQWARGLAWIVNMQMRIEGPRPNPPFFLVANHVSYVDIVVILANLDGVFVAKRELGSWPVLGYLTRLVGTIFLDRHNRRDAVRVLAAIDTRIGDGDGVVVFPEGTSSDGGDVYPMKPAMFEWAAQAGYPVSHAAIHYQTRLGAPAARDAVCWWGTMAFMPHVIELCGLAGFQATLRFGEEPLYGTDRSDLAVRARAAIASNFVPHLPGGSEPG